MTAEEFDVLICGSGSAGLCAAIWLARYGIRFKMLEARDGPLRIGQADGVQCRTVEIFESLGIADALLKESYHVMEIAFWSACSKEGEVGGEQGVIQRDYVGPDTEPGLSHQPHVILNQARVNEIMMDEVVRLSGNQNNVEYGRRVRDVTVVKEAEEDVQVSLKLPYVKVAAEDRHGKSHVYRAQYVLACDGAHSTVRKSLGFHMQGDSSDTNWGVMDVFVNTDFPDIRKKAIIKSQHGSIILIPREGDQLVRFYVELPPSATQPLDLEHLTQRVSQVFQPYQMQIVDTAWWSTYSIGQRLADHFHDSMRVFLTGDACHTHSPKAGQGMNVSLQDGYNIGWKLGQVLTGRAPESLLETYILERKDTATKLIEFDRGFAKLVSSSSSSTSHEDQVATNGDQKTTTTPAERFREQFLAAGRYTAGLATRYPASCITRSRAPGSVGFVCDEAKGITIGMRFPFAAVLRLSDGKPMQLSQALPSDGRWHVVVFSRRDIWSHGLHVIAAKLATAFQGYEPAGSDEDSFINTVTPRYS
ncbi:phenol 2-monooxygenase [Purpureocillium lilacinum]|uniref:Phenol 2-monooxygenase n=1 Tax=Purpureocillium lilacinum TaxID=33203 RepID=A0A179GS62_PURLI|nr:phenol 2-monooxygenase [Purpureocillium lilacinum]